MRNILFIHLESLNYMNYHLNKHMFPNLERWEKKSLSYCNYFSTATSTWMVVSDMMYGGMLQYEVCESMGQIPYKYCYNESLLDKLKHQGYETKVLIYGNGKNYMAEDRRHTVGFQNGMTLIKEYQGYLNEIGKIIKADKPYAMLLCNFMSNLAFNHYIPNVGMESGLNRWKIGYEFLDTWVGDILKVLESADKLKNTTIVFYGDHGDDYLEHGDHEGLTHAIEPYANLIRTPLWIYDGRLSEERCYALINTADIRNIIEKFLKIPEEKFDLSRLKIYGRKYSLSRNCYAAQPMRSGSFNKGYSLSNGRFLFLVSNNGMEMYDIRMDMQCQHNLLKCFVFRDGILRLSEKNELLQHHFVSLMDMSTIRQIRQTFYHFRKKIYDEIWELFHYAECEDKMVELEFQKIHY